jgi:mRNA interferase YafQ
MSIKIKETKIFRKEAKKAFKSGKDLNKLYEIVKKLSQKESLDSKFKDHSLKGKWKESRECHLEPDWLLIYTLKEDYLILERLGSHSELFE